MVAGDYIPLLIHAEAAVRVSVIGESDVQMVVEHEFLQVLDVSGAAVRVDIEAVRIVVDHICLGAEGVEDSLCDHPGRAVRGVQADSLAVVAVF